MTGAETESAVSFHPWPTPLDLAATAGFFGLVLGIVAIGYLCMVLDIRAYLRSLTRTLVCVARYFPHLPDWALRDTPRCLAALGLKLPCTEDDLLRAYRQRVKVLHPDHGGDRRRFLQLQQYFEQALELVRKQEQR